MAAHWRLVLPRANRDPPGGDQAAELTDGRSGPQARATRPGTRPGQVEPSLRAQGEQVFNGGFILVFEVYYIVGDSVRAEVTQIGASWDVVLSCTMPCLPWPCHAFRRAAPVSTPRLVCCGSRRAAEELFRGVPYWSKREVFSSKL
eukprot:scaffold115307_cov60-Phaeocystis_antarctica.AAC.1